MFKKEIEKAYDAIKTRSYVVHPGKWQSVDVSTKPEMATHELLNYTLRAQVTSEDLDVIRKEIEPNLPWADDHFLERVGGVPLNPGEQWKHWPWGHSADKFRTVEEVPQQGGGLDRGFHHTYMERMWPKYANGRYANGTDLDDRMTGIRYNYGDAMDVVEHLAKEPLSRQAYLPIWFPEDTGKLDVRVPCTLGYHFIQRSGYLHCTYYIRSCDIYRHFRDDIYLTVRLQLWMLDELRKRDSNWNTARPGSFTMHIVSLHCFRNDYLALFK
jgi:thymidylate synthase